LSHPGDDQKNFVIVEFPAAKATQQKKTSAV
jgi:hypothetical protein